MNSKELFIGQTSGDIMIINFSRKELDMIDAEDLNDEFDNLINKGKIYFVLNFGNVKFMSTSIMVSLIRLRKRLSEIKGEMNICCLNQHIRRVIELTRLDRVFEIYDTEQAALDALNKIINP
jgi:anti-anti-sigma factor